MSQQTVYVDSKQSILDAAEDLISRYGYAGLSMRELSKHSGLAKSTLYHHFADKDQIYLSVLERDMLVFERRIMEAAASDSDFEGRLRAVIRTYMMLVAERGSVALNAIRRAGILDERLVELFSRHRDQLLKPFMDIFHQGIAEGRMRAVAPELTAISLLGMMNSFAAHRLLVECNSQEVAASPHETAEHTLALFLHGVLTNG